MATPEISMEYASMENAAKVFLAASESYTKMAQTLGNVAEQLVKTGFLGGTGKAAESYIQNLQARLNDLSRRAVEMQSDINKNVASFRNDVDPGIAQRFDT
ncbi:MAG: WXG100 family type VII secretion target [Anaerolineae bacterium]|nr:WXG100 family type VII secretion target [Anaerolineae bacterium]